MNPITKAQERRIETLKTFFVGAEATIEAGYGGQIYLKLVTKYEVGPSFYRIYCIGPRGAYKLIHSTS